MNELGLTDDQKVNNTLLQFGRALGDVVPFPSTGEIIALHDLIVGPERFDFREALEVILLERNLALEEIYANESKYWDRYEARRDLEDILRGPRVSRSHEDE